MEGARGVVRRFKRVLTCNWPGFAYLATLIVGALATWH